MGRHSLQETSQIQEWAKRNSVHKPRVAGARDSRWWALLTGFWMTLLRLAFIATGTGLSINFLAKFANVRFGWWLFLFLSFQLPIATKEIDEFIHNKRSPRPSKQELLAQARKEWHVLLGFAVYALANLISVFSAPASYYLTERPKDVKGTIALLVVTVTCLASAAMWFHKAMCHRYVLDIIGRVSKEWSWLKLANLLFQRFLLYLAAGIAVGMLLQDILLLYHHNTYPAPGVFYRVNTDICSTCYTHVQCKENLLSSSTVDAVMVYGYKGSPMDFDSITPEFENYFRKVCIIDRYGYGWSSPAPDEKRKGIDISTQLYRAIKEEKLGPDVFLFGHSAAGLFIPPLVNLSKTETDTASKINIKGIVFLDPVFPDPAFSPKYGSTIQPDQTEVVAALFLPPGLTRLILRPSIIPILGVYERFGARTYAKAKSFWATIPFVEVAVHERIWFPDICATSEDALVNIKALADIPVSVYYGKSGYGYSFGFDQYMDLRTRQEAEGDHWFFFGDSGASQIYESVHNFLNSTIGTPS